jgi:hypothetical protein
MAANGHSSEYLTDGINPFFQTQEAIRNSVVNQLLPQMAREMWAGTVTRVFFYGAGCTPEKSPLLAEVLEQVFKKATAEVHSDMTGAARGVLGRESGIACILGTGSNSCVYDGSEIRRNVPALGFILGDEGSGAVLGKRITADVLKGVAGQEMRERFLTHFGTTQAEIIENVYRRPFPNRYLAGLSRFCAEHIDEPYIAGLVYDHFEQFVKRNLMQYFTGPEALEPGKTKIGFVGSIAYYYKETLSRVLSDHGLCATRIVQSPMEGLKEYHRADAVPTQM